MTFLCKLLARISHLEKENRKEIVNGCGRFIGYTPARWVFDIVRAESLFPVVAKRNPGPCGNT